MSRQSIAAPRNLTLPEELEKLEQSITLTLQEIDHNFSRAHRIVTTSILPIVEQYAEHSKDVWEGSMFWKQFFEASANVSLSGYEENPTEEETVTEEEATSTATPSQSTYGSTADDQTVTPINRGYPDLDDALSPSPSRNTPRPPLKSKISQSKPSTAPYSSPYETLKRETIGSVSRNDSPSESTLPSTPGAHASPQPQSSPFAPPSTNVRGTAHRTPSNDVLLHRVLDKNWRIQATPHSTAQDLSYRPKTGQLDQTPMPSTARKAQRSRSDRTEDLDSSPAIAAPELHAEIFDTPARKSRVPGVSVLTPAGARKNNATADTEAKSRGKEQANLWDSDEEDEDVDGGMGISPPKTMQFHVPQGRFIRTPAREASKRIVEDLLLTAGGNVTDDFNEDSPSIVRRGGLLEEDTF